MLVKRHEIGDPGEFSRMTDEELEACLRAEGRALGLPEDAIERMLSRWEPVPSGMRLEFGSANSPGT